MGAVPFFLSKAPGVGAGVLRGAEDSPSMADAGHLRRASRVCPLRVDGNLHRLQCSWKRSAVHEGQ